MRAFTLLAIDVSFFRRLRAVTLYLPIPLLLSLLSFLLGCFALVYAYLFLDESPEIVRRGRQFLAIHAMVGAIVLLYFVIEKIAQHAG